MNELRQNPNLDDPYVTEIQSKFATLNPRWSKHLFHYTDVINAKSILNGGAIYSRKIAQENQTLAVDCAGSDIIRNTEDWIKEYVRLYFRPLTPPFYHVEGFRPDDNKDSEFRKHCPVPVYFLFGFKEIFSIIGVKFSDINLARHSRNLYASRKDLLKLDYRRIYHSNHLSDVDSEEKGNIIGKRCAEVIVPNELRLNGYLKEIGCRSMAEKELLLNLLDDEKRNEYSKRISVKSHLFNRMWHYVKSVDLQADRIKFDFQHPPSAENFTYKLNFKSHDRDIEQIYDMPQFKFIINNPPGDYSVSLSIDDHPAYMGNYEDLPSPL